MLEEVAASAISCTPISSRLISIRISARPHDITSDHDEEEVEQFYEQPDYIIVKMANKDIR